MASARRKAVSEDYGHVPSRGWYAFGVFLTYIIELVFRVRKHVDPAVHTLKGPVICLGNHPSYLDPFLMASACWPIRINMLAQNDLFRVGILRWFLSKIGVIPKVQFRTDTRAVKAMFRVLRRGGFLGVFPEGTRSPDGTGAPFTDTIARTAKKNGAAVLTSHVHGAYLSWPRWAAKGARVRIGRIENHTRVLFTQEDIKNLSVQEIHEGMCQALAFNDYDWQRENHIRFSGKKQAEGLSDVLHQCPRCKADLSIRTEGNRIFCTACGNEGTMDRYGLLHPNSEDDVIPDDPAAWHAWQKDQMRLRTQDPNFVLESDIPLLEISQIEGSFEPAGSGSVRVDQEGIRFTGTIEGKEDSFFIRLARIPGFSADFGERFGLVLKDVSYRMHPDNGQKVIMLLDAVETLRDEAEQEES